ncbi:hypothetical protein RB653_003175 [Dictyostelium firmibasis]|uniref:Uncharacterized protein n=1 Tax=Dictyostelium firmibasis TaxID=79012 RepID=A0AAN7TQ35_9MYCE
MQLVDWLSSHAKVEDINKERFGLELKNELELKEWNTDMENRYKKNQGDLNGKALETCSKRLGIPTNYINNRVLCEAINYFISEGDTDKADTLFAKAIGNGCAEAIYLLALFHTQSNGNIEDSLELYEQVSQLPPFITLADGTTTIPNSMVTDSMYLTASFYFNGIGKERDVVKAIEFYNKGIELNNEKCIRDLGLLYIEGVGVEKDIEKGLDLLKKGSDLGDPVSKYNYGMLLFNDSPIEGFKFIQEAADLGVEEAQNKVKLYKPTIEKILLQSNITVEEELLEKSKRNNKNKNSSSSKNKSKNKKSNKVVIIEESESPKNIVEKPKNRIIDDCDSVD